MIRGVSGVLVAGAVFVSSLAVAEPVRAVDAPLVGTLSASSRQLPASIDGDASVAPVPAAPSDVLLEPPSTAVKPAERSVEKPAVAGFDESLSVEDVDQRDVFSTVFDNVDGTETAVFSSMAVNFEDDRGEWQRIDPTLVPAQESGAFEVKSAPWSASFAADGATVVGGAGTTVAVRPGAGGRLSAPVIAADGLSATYVEAWPGVDLRFVVDNVSVRKELVIKRPGVQPSYELVFDGLGLVAADGGGFRLTDASISDVSVGGVEVFNRDGTPINEAAKPVEAVAPTTASRPGEVASAVTVGVNAAWLSSLDKAAFPVVIDPVITIGAMNGVRFAFAGNGFTCPQNPNCARPRVGNSMASGNTIWRSVFAYDYTSLLPTATVGSKLVSATMNVSHYSGTTSSQPISVRQASWFTWCGVHVGDNCSNPWMPIVDTTKWITTGSTSFNVKSKIDEFWTVGGNPVTERQVRHRPDQSTQCRCSRCSCRRRV